VNDDIPETVMITYRPKPGLEAALSSAVDRHWNVTRALDLVLPTFHVTLDTKDESGRPCTIDIFTWRDEDIPDNAPADVQKVWSDLSQLTESRNGHPGIEIAKVTRHGLAR
jgi:hypothetical protein